MFKLKSLTVRRIGDPNGREALDYLETEWDGKHITKSMRYSNEDIAKYGVEQVGKWIAEDHQRIADFNDGKFEMWGIRAEAELLHTSDDINAGSLHDMTSPALWGIESDSDEDYLKEVGEAELAGLRAILADMGISREEFDACEVYWPTEVLWE